MNSRSQRRRWGTLLVGLTVGAGVGLAYATLVGVVYLGVYARWDRVPAFAAWSVAAGAAAGLAIAAGVAFPSRGTRAARSLLSVDLADRVFANLLEQDMRPLPRPVYRDYNPSRGVGRFSPGRSRP
jgi:hypothetical protein